MMRPVAMSSVRTRRSRRNAYSRGCAARSDPSASKTGWPVERLDWLFSSTHRTGACSGGAMQPNNIAHLLHEEGIGRRLESFRAVWPQVALQMRGTVEGTRSTASAIDWLQCVVSFGVVSRVSRTVSAISSSPISRGCPGQGVPKTHPDASPSKSEVNRNARTVRS